MIEGKLFSKGRYTLIIFKYLYDLEVVHSEVELLDELS